MERDIRRGRGQWRGCYAFRDIICDSIDDRDDASGSGLGSSSSSFGTPKNNVSYKRNGGLKMGHTYYYYYELDGSVETHDPAVPSTTACPYLPGQTVNTLNVPVEQALRQRSASCSSMRHADLKTMNPDSKYITPRPALPATLDNTPLRLGTSPALQHKTSTRSLSPGPGAWKRFFTRRLASRDGERGRSRDRDDQSIRSGSVAEEVDSRCATPSEGVRSRDMSPESLRRFLSDDLPPRPDSNLSERPSVVIPEDIVEENEDDDNFATSAVSENSEHQHFTTSLSPPPFKRSASSDSMPLTNSSSLTLMPARPSSQPVQEIQEAPASAVAPSLPKLETIVPPQAPFSPSSSTFASPIFPQSPGYEVPTFYDDTDDDDGFSSNNSDCFSFQPSASVKSQNRRFEVYSLPEQEETGSKIFEPQPAYAKLNSPPLLARGDAGISVSSANFLGSPIDTGLDDFVNELGWIVDVIGTKRN
ncbi:Fc.00g006820.m01.CDS01 [Cosmosporella sp. VM-42]